jgi:hypothetical protein
MSGARACLGHAPRSSRFAIPSHARRGATRMHFNATAAPPRAHRARRPRGSLPRPPARLSRFAARRRAPQSCLPECRFHRGTRPILNSTSVRTHKTTNVASTHDAGIVLTRVSSPITRSGQITILNIVRATRALRGKSVICTAMAFASLKHPVEPIRSSNCYPARIISNGRCTTCARNSSRSCSTEAIGNSC